MPPGVSVAIPSLDHRPGLMRLLDSLAAQRFDGAWEVLVVDNGGRDGSAAAVEGRRGDFPAPLRVAIEPRRGVAHARNRALRETTAPVLLFADDDTTCCPGWISAHARAFRDPGVVATGGRILPVLPPGTPDWFRDLHGDGLGGPTSRYDLGDAELEPASRGLDWLPFGANLGLRREPALANGGFRADLGWGRDLVPGEETELLRRLLASGGRILYQPHAVVLHHVRASRVTWDYARRWQMGYGRAQVRTRPPSGLARLGGAAASAQRLAVWSLRASLRERRGQPAKRVYRARLRAAEAEGRLRELLGR